VNAHNHHHCTCKHERLRFCDKCKVPHCLDCGKEWVEHQYHYDYWYYPHSTGLGPSYLGQYDSTPTITCGNNISATALTSNLTQGPGITIAPGITMDGSWCEH